MTWGKVNFLLLVPIGRFPENKRRHLRLPLHRFHQQVKQDQKQDQEWQGDRPTPTGIPNRVIPFGIGTLIQVIVKSIVFLNSYWCMHATTTQVFVFSTLNICEHLWKRAELAYLLISPLSYRKFTFPTIFVILPWVRIHGFRLSLSFRILCSPWHNYSILVPRSSYLHTRTGW